MERTHPGCSGNSSGYDWSVFWHGDRQPDQSFAACVDQNIKETTFGQIDPQKLAKVIPAAAVGVAGALAGKIPFNIPFDPGTGGITAFTASAYGIGRALGVRKKRKRTNHNSTRRQRIRDTKKAA